MAALHLFEARVDLRQRDPLGDNAVEIEQPAHVEWLDADGIPKRRLNCQLYQRSCDLFLGVPFNIASYALLTHIIAREANLTVGELVWSGGDVHIYKNHVEAVQEQLMRAPLPLPQLEITKGSLGSYEVDDFVLVGYVPWPTIKAPMAV